MPRRPDLPCADCGTLMWRGTTSLPEGQARCRPCRRARPGDKRIGPTNKRFAVCSKCGEQMEVKPERNPTGTPTCSRCRRATKAERLSERANCLACGQEFAVWLDRGRKGLDGPRVTCSPACGRKRNGMLTKKRPEDRTPAKPRVPKDAWPVYFPRCADCREPFTSRVPNAKRCADCRRKHANRRGDRGYHKRAVHYGVEYVHINKVSIFERDGWRCYLCRKKVRRAWLAGHPMNATLDHIVPMSCGGGHVPTNVRTCCWACNIAKGAGGGYEQLLLVG